MMASFQAAMCLFIPHVSEHYTSRRAGPPSVLLHPEHAF